MNIAGKYNLVARPVLCLQVIYTSAALPKREPARAPSPPASAHEWTTDSEEEYIVGTDQSSDGRCWMLIRRPD